MAMLAEPKRKMKYSTDPRGLNWSNDSDKFGQKLMEKMGWKRGKGLGAKEDGNVDHVKATVKLDTAGFGCSKSFADNWVAHQDDFNALLANLNADQGVNAGEALDCAKVQKLEEKGETSKGRLHYKKFTKGKDLSRASGVDMDCIFGRRKSKSEPASPRVQSEDNSDAESTSSTPEPKTHGVKTLTSSLSVQQYFAAKMAALKSGSQAEKLTDERSKTSSKRKCEEYLNDAISEEKSKKKKKRKKKPEQEDSIKYEDNYDMDKICDNCEDHDSNDIKTKKKQKKQKQILTKGDCDILDNSDTTKNKSKKKKKSKSKA